MAEDQINSVIRDKAERFFLYLESGVYNKSSLSFDMLFKIILYSISQFGIRESELSDVRDDNLPSKEIWEKFRKSYSGDSTLFEVGCFLYFLIDQWLRESKPKINESVFFNTLLNPFVKQFNKIFGHVNSRDFYKQRYSKYREIAEERGNIENYYFYVEQLIFLTENNTQPKEHNFERITIVPFTYSFWIRAQFFDWYECMVTQIYKVLEIFLAQHEETEEHPF